MAESQAVALRKQITGEAMQAEIAKALPKHIGVEKFTRVALTAINSNPDIVKANPNTILAACMSCAQDGLLPDGRESALVVFNTKKGPAVQYMPMVAGVIKKVRNSGELKSLECQVVYDNDEFDYAAGDEGYIHHKPTYKGDPGEMIGVYAVATLKSGEKVREYMRMDEIEKVRKSSRASSGGPWSQWFSEMARKTVIRRLAKRLPSTSDLTRMLEANDEHMGLKDITPPKAAGGGEESEPPTEPKKRKTSSSRLKQAVGKDEGEEQEEVPPPKCAPDKVTDVEEDEEPQEPPEDEEEEDEFA